MKRGFTLVELLAVIVLIAIIAILGAGGIASVRKNVKRDLCQSTIDLIETGAKHYGEDFQNQLKSNGCSAYGVGGVCKMVKVQDLIDYGYINVKATPKKDANGNDVINSITNEVEYEKIIKNDFNDEILNNKMVFITLEGMVYAKVESSVKCE